MTPNEQLKETKAAREARKQERKRIAAIRKASTTRNTIPIYRDNRPFSIWADTSRDPNASFLNHDILQQGG
jgi:hypothetical protein